MSKENKREGARVKTNDGSDHEESDAEGVVFECNRSECTKTFKHNSSRTRHQNTCTKGEVLQPLTTITCENDWCSKTFDRSNNYKRHLLTCKPKSAKSFVCMEPGCEKTFEKHSKLLRHQPTHSRVTFSCSVCFAVYKRLDHFQKHQLTCGENSRPVPNPPVRISRASMAGLGQSSPPISSAECSSISTDAPFLSPAVLPALHAEPNSPPTCFGSFNPSVDNPPSSALPVVHVDENSPVISSAACSSTSYNAHQDGPSSLSDNSLNTASSFSSLNGLSSPGDSVDFVATSMLSTSSFDVNAQVPCMVDESPSVYVLDDSYSALDDELARSWARDSESQLSKFESTVAYQREVANSTLKVLKRLRHQAKNSSVKLKEFASMCVLLYKDKLQDLNFMDMLADDLGFLGREELIKFMNSNDEINVRQRGRPMSGMVVRQAAYDFWKDNSSISNDRRNARHVAKIKPSKLDRAVKDLQDDRVSEFLGKGGIKLKAQKHVYSNTVRELYRQFKVKHPDLTMSPALFYRCKPFYISPATEREMESCLCAKCLNPHALYNTLRRHIKSLPPSLSEYLTSTFTCSQDPTINFPKIECLRGECKNNCRITDESTKEMECWEKRVSYYQFGTVQETYYNIEGEKKHYDRTARIDYKDKDLRSVYNLFQESARDYLLHRYHTLLDKVHWERYLNETDSAVIWMDYSQNIKLVEKNQSQSAHFSGKQQTLHDTLIVHKGVKKYIYHLSDDTNHDSVMTMEILKTILEDHPEIIETGKLVLRSDNCATQYKSRFVFKALLDLAEEHQIRIDFFYGEAGHGRGLIDAMAWFGCKGPMRKEIVTRDAWFATAAEMHSFLSEHFMDDESKEYHLVDPEVTAARRREGREEQKIKGCKASHVISFHPDGSYAKWLTVKDFMDNNEMVSQAMGEDDNEEDNETEITPETEWIGSIDIHAQYSVIEKDSFVAIKAEPGHPELFLVMRIDDKQIAEKNMMDSSGEHCVLKGEPYLIGTWFSFDKETKKFAWYRESKAEKALIHVGEVVAMDLELNDKHQMDIFEYRMLTARVYHPC